MNAKTRTRMAIAIAACTFGVVSECHAMIAWNGIEVNGLALNGVSLNGLTANGLTANGLTANGLTANGLGLNGPASRRPDDPSLCAAKLVNYDPQLCAEVKDLDQGQAQGQQPQQMRTIVLPNGRAVSLR